MARRRRQVQPPKQSFRVVPDALGVALARLQGLRPVPVSPIGDRRLFHPAGPYRPAFSLERSASRLVVRPRKKAPAGIGNRPRFVSAGVGFAVPEKVGICIRRKDRREVLFARGSAGRGKRMPGRKRRSWFSDVSC